MKKEKQINLNTLVFCTYPICCFYCAIGINEEPAPGGGGGGSLGGGVGGFLKTAVSEALACSSFSFAIIWLLMSVSSIFSVLQLPIYTACQKLLNKH